MKPGGLIGVAIAVVALLMLGGCLSGQYNGLVRSREDVGKAWAQVDNQLQRRGDLIGNLVESAKGIAVQEQVVFGEIANARAAMAGAKTPAAGIAAANQLDGALGRLLVVVENYPQLKSNEAFLALMDEVTGTENRIAVERGRYNGVVRDFNVKVKQFPVNLVASSFGFKDQPYYEVSEAAKAVPKVDFSGLRKGAIADSTR